MYCTGLPTYSIRFLCTKRYGVPQIDKVPDGFSPLAEVWGKGRNRDPLLVSFVFPNDWIVTLPSQDVNGEDGTIQAGEYARGDTATFYVYTEPGKVAVSTIDWILLSLMMKPVCYL